MTECDSPGNLGSFNGCGGVIDGFRYIGHQCSGGKQHTTFKCHQTVVLYIGLRTTVVCLAFFILASCHVHAPFEKHHLVCLDTGDEIAPVFDDC